MSELPHLLPDMPFPPYAFVPGQSPHPESDPAGHSYGKKPEPVERFDPEQWQQCRTYLRGLDLFNHGYFWEAHEAWEQLWHVAGRKGGTANFLKGLIKLAAAGVKHLEKKPAGVASHSHRAAELFKAIGTATEFMGLRLSDLIEAAERIDGEGWPDIPPILRPSLTPHRNHLE